MASSKSYTITLRNNRTERDALDLMLRIDPLLYEPDSEGRKSLLARLGIDGRLSRAFDIVLYSSPFIQKVKAMPM